jgi:hypothetical protein
MRVLIACECSGVVRDAFKRAGHHAVSCDLVPTDAPGLHYQGDAIDLLDGWEPVQFAAQCDPDGDGWCATVDQDPNDCHCVGPTQDGIEYKETAGGILLGRPVENPAWDLMIAHPPCTYLSVSGLHWNGRVPGRTKQTEDALDFVRALMAAPIKHIALENPVSCISSKIRKPDQIIQPWWFGHDASKKTCLWLKNLPKLKETNRLPGDDKTRRANQTPSGQNKLGPSPTRAKDRSKTYEGIADAMAGQWGNVLEFQLA